ncbi:Thymosin beta [Amphibalanus amphitrite]|uniref:Thymosin beta n=1 Tax=Amphibalanus amphitrite TaxID=1232801 RepID=A0A6A4X7T0_AMPAM|nr:Thymosin beta [Amphibalanus amphitrite]
MAAPTSPTLKDLPKVAPNVKSELEGFTPDKLKHTETQEKVVLPTKEDVEQEKQHNALLEGVEKFDAERLKKTETQEKNRLPSPDDVQQERTHQDLLSGVEHFDKHSMKAVTLAEKTHLPSTEVSQFHCPDVLLTFAEIQQEKTLQSHLDGIENFDANKLKHADTVEKNPLPTADEQLLYMSRFASGHRRQTDRGM